MLPLAVSVQQVIVGLLDMTNKPSHTFMANSVSFTSCHNRSMFTACLKRELAVFVEAVGFVRLNVTLSVKTFFF